MNILVISDLHMDTGDRFGTFKWNEMDMISHLEFMQQSFRIDKIILNGDIFELMKYKLEEIRKAYPELMNYFKNKDFIFIRGNHDIISGFGEESVEIINSSGQRIHIEHGHNADWFNGLKFGRTLGRFGFSILKKLSDRRYLMDIYFKIVALEDAINHIPKKYNTLKYLTYALKLLKDHDVVILAHTHKLEAHHTYYLNKKKRYLNSGTCSLGRFQGIIMDTETLKYELIKETRASAMERFQLGYAV